MANSGVVDFNADLMGFWRSDLDVLETQIFTGLPSHGSFASDGLDIQRSVLMLSGPSNFMFFRVIVVR